MSIYCSGQSAGCDGDKQDWLMAEQCDEAEVCSEDAGVCVGKEQCSCSTPTVYSVIPAQAQLNHETLFTVTGCKLPLSAAAWIGNCMDVQYLSHTSEQFTFSCWPTSSTGPQEGHIRTEAGGVLLKQFFVDFYQ